MLTIWQFDNSTKPGSDAATFAPYSAEHSKLLTKALHAGDEKIKVSLSKQHTLEVNLSSGEQVNPSTKVKRRIRLLCYDDSKQQAFCWEVDLKPWSLMSPSVAVELESSFHSTSNTFDKSIGSNQYTFDTKYMSQLNKSTGFKRQLRRTFVPDSQWKNNCSILTKDLKIHNLTSTTSAGRQTRKSGRQKRKKSSSVSDEDDNVNNTASTSAATKTSQPTTKKTKVGQKSVGAVVDKECKQLFSKASVHSENGDVFDAMLNQTNVQFNNNKFYLLQLLKSVGSYYVWFRWGRVGKVGQSSLTNCGGDLERAKKMFCGKFRDKTSNDWGTGTFQKVDGKYDVVARDYGADEDDTAVAVQKKVKVEESKLPSLVRQLLEMLFDVSAMQSTVADMSYDTKKMPLGKLTKEQVKAGFAALKEIETLIEAGKTSGKDLVKACNKFYTRIPHDFGMRVPPLITDRKLLSEKNELLQALEQIQIAMNMMSGESRTSVEHPADKHYRQLHCDITVVEPSSSLYTLLDNYTQRTHGPTHNLYRLSIESIYEIQRAGENELFQKDLGNVVLLWHGSRLSNWAGIVSQGLRIAPADAPVTGYMFGKGVYFADVSSKSANYSYATPSSPYGLLCLAEVALGTSREVTQADYNAAKLPSGYHSIKGLGQLVPDETTFIKQDGVLIPSGKLISSGVSTVLNYNEFVVYSTKQIRLRYLLKVKFCFGKK